VLLETGRGEQQIAISLTVLLGVLDIDAFEALCDRAGAFISSQQTTTRSNHGQRSFIQYFLVHMQKTPIVVVGSRTGNVVIGDSVAEDAVCSEPHSR
jgi:hypothetical protein